MENKRMTSRSIIVDPVNDRISKIRYDNHVTKLSHISNGKLLRTIDFEDHNKDIYLDNIEKYKRSNTYVKELFDNRMVENKSLVRKMEDIDRRKNPFRSEDKNLPPLYRKTSNSEDKKQLKKENQMLVKRILQHRATRTKEEIIK